MGINEQKTIYPVAYGELLAATGLGVGHLLNHEKDGDIRGVGCLRSSRNVLILRELGVQLKNKATWLHSGT
jgi:hypothetical protein